MLKETIIKVVTESNPNIRKSIKNLFASSFGASGSFGKD